jgi:hypothetical protein
VLERYFDYLKGLVSEALNDETFTLRQFAQRKLLRKRLDAIFRKCKEVWPCFLQYVRPY